MIIKEMKVIDNPIDIDLIRKDFPILNRKVNNKPLIYFDSAASTQKPVAVINRIRDYYENENSNVHRGVHYLSQKATEAYEKARERVKDFINAEHSHEIIFTGGTTGSINLVASSYGGKFIEKGDEIIVTEMEHHSNIVPWQILCDAKNASLKVIPVTGNGELIIEEFEKLINKRTKLLSVTHVSNTLGTVNSIKEIIKKAHSHNIIVLIDGAQAVPHLKIDVNDLGCDFYCFSGHKMFGPLGIGDRKSVV